MNITLENAKGVSLDKMNQLILSSEWFMSHGTMSGVSNLTYTPNKHIELITASSNNQVIGRCIFANFTDEVNFGLTNDVEKLKNKQKQLISQIDARMKSRFLRGNKLQTLNIIALILFSLIILVTIISILFKYHNEKLMTIIKNLESCFLVLCGNKIDLERYSHIII